MGNNPFRKFLVIWLGQLLSGIGSGMTAFALGVYVYHRTNSAENFAMVILCLFLPSILLRPLGGLLADRFNRKFLVIAGDICSILGSAFLLAAVISGNADLWKLYLGVAVISAFTALQNPAYKALVSDLLTKDQFSRAGGMVQLASSAQHIFSPVIAGLLLGISNIETILLIDIASFFTAALAVLSITVILKPEVNPARQSVLQDMREGLLAVTSDRGVLFLVLVISMITFFIGFLQTLFAPMILSFSDVRTLGIIQSVSAMGMLYSSLLLSIVNISIKKRVVLITGLALAGVSISTMGVTTWIVLITGAFFFFYSALPLINVSAEVMIRNNIPNDKQGRAWGIIGVLSQLGFIGAYIMSGYLADHVFNPLLAEGGVLAPSIGKITGSGPGRGIGFMLLISGFCIVTIAFIAARTKTIKSLNNS